MQRSWDTGLMLQFDQREWWLAYSAALRVVRAPDQAEDVAQEALLRAFRARHRFDGRATPESWLWRIAHNAAISYARAARRSRALGEDHRVASEWTNELGPRSPEEIASSREDLQALDACLRVMNDRNRTAFIASELLGVTARELGALVGISPNAAKQRTFRARRSVRSRFEQLSRQPNASVRASPP